MMSARARAGFEQALEGHPFVSVDDLEADVLNGRAYVWSGDRSDVFTRIENGVCEMGPVAGDLEEMMERALPDIERWARDNQCREMFVQAGRSGWVRELAPHGYELAAVILRKKL